MKVVYTFKKGFSLLEVAVVLAIMGILITSGIAMFAFVTEKNRSLRTIVTMSSMHNSILDYVYNHGYLPNKTHFEDNMFPGENILDGYGHAIEYLPYSYFTEDYFTSGGNQEDKANMICRLKHSGWNKTICVDEHCADQSKVVRDIAYALYSPGKNGQLDNVTKGQGFDLSVASDSTFGDMGYVHVTRARTSGQPRNLLDDTYQWKSITDLASNMECAGYSLDIVTERLPSFPNGGTFQNSDDEIRIYATGGLLMKAGSPDGVYHWCVNVADMDNRAEDILLKGYDVTTDTAGTNDRVHLSKGRQASTRIDNCLVDASQSGSSTEWTQGNYLIINPLDPGYNKNPGGGVVDDDYRPLRNYRFTVYVTDVQEYYRASVTGWPNTRIMPLNYEKKTFLINNVGDLPAYP